MVVVEDMVKHAVVHNFLCKFRRALQLHKQVESKYFHKGTASSDRWRRRTRCELKKLEDAVIALFVRYWQKLKAKVGRLATGGSSSLLSRCLDSNTEVKVQESSMVVFSLAHVRGVVVFWGQRERFKKIRFVWTREKTYIYTKAIDNYQKPLVLHRMQHHSITSRSYVSGRRGAGRQRLCLRCNTCHPQECRLLIRGGKAR